MAQPEIWGRYIESCVGAHLMNSARVEAFEVNYWRSGKEEVDFVLKQEKHLCGLEVKTQARGKTSGLKAFKADFPQAKTWVVTYSELPTFFDSKVSGLF